MSLFNMVMGTNPFASIFLYTLGFREEGSIPRLRDCFVDSEDRIVVMTRTGGGNRGDYREQNRALEDRTGFLDTVDWPTDETYAFFRYEIPASHKEAILVLAELGGRCDITAKFNAALEGVRDPGLPNLSTEDFEAKYSAAKELFRRAESAACG